MNQATIYLSVVSFAVNVLGATAQTGGAVAPVSNNPSPVVRHNLHLPEIRLHDPWILAHAPSKTYYLYTSNNGRATGVNRPGTMVYRSKDLLNWEGPSVVFALPQGTWAADQSAWAPEVHEYQGKFYLFTTLHNPQK